MEPTGDLSSLQFMSLFPLCSFLPNGVCNITSNWNYHFLLNINPKELALLCQKVKNHVVGAPCGVMDQMDSACGEANKLLAMVFQPTEVLDLVDIPNHIRFWGIDSRIRHRIEGATINKSLLSLEECIQ